MGIWRLRADVERTESTVKKPKTSPKGTDVIVFVPINRHAMGNAFNLMLVETKCSAGCVDGRFLLLLLFVLVFFF